MALVDDCANITQAESWTEKCRIFCRLYDQWRAGYIDTSLLYGNFSPFCIGIKRSIVDMVCRMRVREIPGIFSLDECPLEQYGASLEILLDVEALYNIIDARNDDIPSQQLETVMEDGRLIRFGFTPTSTGITDNRWYSSVARDFVVLETHTGRQIALQIESMRGQFVSLPVKAHSEYGRNLMAKPVKVSFLPTSSTFRYRQMALKNLKNSETMKSLIFVEVGHPRNEVKFSAGRRAVFEQLGERLHRLNAGQQAAMVGILEAKCRPKPYILFGPPGTGKTHTLIEAVFQVYERSEGKAKILVCTNSNYCLERLYKQIRAEFDSQVRIIELASGNFKTNSEDFEIIVTTNIKCGCLRKACKFDYVFIDDSSQMDVAGTLIPAELLNSNGCLVLVGDLKGLAPTVSCEEARELGLGISLMERLMKFGIYKIDPRTGNYDPRFITQLQINHRCEQRLSATNNKLFYDNQLEFAGKTPDGLLKILLLTSPLQMIHVDGTEDRIPESESMYNQAEIDTCVDLIKRLYCMGIEPHQIGVISPYMLQARKIKSALFDSIDGNNDVSTILNERFAWIKKFEEGITIEAIRERDLPEGVELCKKEDDGSFIGCTIETLPSDLSKLFMRRHVAWKCKVERVEGFEGGEKDIIIISTVRAAGADKQSLHFLSDSGRFNVATSRAKKLLIVVGNAHLLERTEHWKELIAESQSEIDAWPKSFECSQPFSQQQPLFRSC